MKDTQIVCAVRQVPVARTPEECVRQDLLGHLFRAGGYPQYLTRVELPLSFFSDLPCNIKRRLDVVCFYTKDDTILPLLLIECKAKRPQAGVIKQLLGYNFYVKAPFVAIVWGRHIVLYDEAGLYFEGPFEQMPEYKELKSRS